MNRQLATVAVQEVAPAGLAIAAVLCTVLLPDNPLGFVLTCATLVVIWATHRPPAPGTAVPVRVLLAATALMATVRDEPTRWDMISSGVLVVGLLLHERLLGRAARPWFRATNLPPPSRWAPSLTENGTLWLVNSGLVATFALGGLLDWPAWPLLALTAAATALSAGLAVGAWLRWRSRHRTELAALRQAVQRHQPQFLLYFSAPAGSEYQARMWLPHLERIGAPFLVVMPESHSLAAIAAATSAPVITHRSFEALDAVMVPSLRAAFYVNNGMKNAHCVRYAHLTHIQLYHGDSDKAVTTNPVNAMYDRIFVAGQAAIDRFAANGVSIPPEKFRIVGRPQVAELEVAEQHISERAGTVAERDSKVVEPGGKVVLYAPTWHGAYADANYCSLPIATTIVAGLLERGVTVILRAHPYTERDRRSTQRLREVERLLARDRARTGREHRWGRAATAELTLHECMNRADALISDVSSVASEFLYSGKPFAITNMVGDSAGFTRAFPLAAAAYVVQRGAGNLAQVLDDLLERDPLRQTRREIRTYYLGDFPPERYADAFRAEARRYLTGDAATGAPAAVAGAAVIDPRKPADGATGGATGPLADPRAAGRA